MSDLTYKVKREGNDVFYYIYRGDELVTKNEILPIDLGFWGVMLNSGEALNKKLLKRANKQAQYAIDNMVKYEC